MSGGPATSAGWGPALDEDGRARVALSRLGEPGDAALHDLVARLGAVEVLAGIRDGSLGEGVAGYRSRLGLADVDRDLEVAGRAGISLLLPGDPRWPAQLADLGSREPLLLWVAGDDDLASATRRSVAVVGARACTSYGEHVAADIAVGLADRGWTVVSGGAFGIDAAAHRGALAVGGTTVAVLACGADVTYPAAHEDLLSRVRASGSVVSELPPGSRPTRLRFLDRNRVIAALSRGTVVVEAAMRSGARNTAGHADELSRVVMAVPGAVTSSASVGCHALIRDYGALLVTRAEEVVDAVGAYGEDALSPLRGEDRPEDALDPATRRLFEALPLRRFATPDGLAAVAGLAGPAVLRGLALLSAAGLAESRDGAWRRAVPARPA